MKVVEEKIPRGKIVRIFDSNSNVIEKQEFYKIFGLFYRPSHIFKYEYDQNNGKIKSFNFSSDGTQLLEIQHYYNEKGQEIKCITISKNGKGITVYEYDNEGRKISEEGRLIGGHKYRNQWSFDSNGNKSDILHLDY